MNWNTIAQTAQTTITGVGLQVLGAIVLYIVGRWLISFAVGLVVDHGTFALVFHVVVSIIKSVLGP